MNFDPSILKFNYTVGGDFTLTGSDYVGYFNVSKGAYGTGRYNDERSKELIPTDRIKTDMYKSDQFPDRIIVDDINLPNTLDEILIAPNELVTSQIFNSHLKRIYENTLYLYTKLFLASNNIPVGYGGMAAVSAESTTLRWMPPSKVTVETIEAANAGLDQLDNMKGGISAKLRNGSGFVLFTFSPTHFIALSSNNDRTSIKTLLSSSYIDNNTEQQYTNLTHMSLSGDNLFMVDGGTNYVYKYNIRGFLIDDFTTYNKRYLVEVMGGTGGLARKNKFDGANVVCVGHDRVYVSDENNKCIKVYDDNLVWKNTLSLSRENLRVADIEFYELHNVVYVLLENVSNYDFWLWITNKDMTTVIDKIDINESYEQLQDANTEITQNRAGRVILDKDNNERYLGISFSSQDSNIFYLYTDLAIYKKFVSRPDKTIGKWLFTKLGLMYSFIWNYVDISYNDIWIVWNTLSGGAKEDLFIKSFSITQREDNSEDIFVFAATGIPEAGRFYYANEYTLYDSALYNTDVNVYTSKKWGAMVDEYVQSITVNKEIFKQAHNMLMLKNLLRGRFKAEYDAGGNLVNKQYLYITDTELENLMISNLEDLQVHDNEHVSSEVINRPLTILYNMQDQIINLSKTKILNISPTTSLTGSNTLIIE